MTVNDIKNAQFSESKRGYNTEEVDSYLSKVGDYVSELETQKEELQKKLEILARKIEEYREDEESIREALLGAQKLGKSVVSEANEKAKAIVDEAQKKADEILSSSNEKADKIVNEASTSASNQLKQTKYDIEKEQKYLDKLQREVSKFKTELLEIYRDHIDLIKRLPSVEEDNKEEEVKSLDKELYEQKVEEAKAISQSEVDKESQNTDGNNAENTSEEEMSPGLAVIKEQEYEATKEYDKPTISKITDNENDQENADNTSHSRKSKFTNLQFGSNSKKE